MAADAEGGARMNDRYEDTAEEFAARLGLDRPHVVVPFPKPYRHPLPPDAIPRGRERHVVVFPRRGKWSCLDSDDGGCSQADGMTKERAIQAGLEYVMEMTATMEVINHDIYAEVEVAS
jgi:hypothetical protein